MSTPDENVATETLRVDESQGRTVQDSVGAAISRVYELQLVAIGMILAKPSMLENVKTEDFCDAEIHSLVNTLKSKSDSKRGEVEKFLGDRGVEPYVSRGLDSLDGVTERLHVDGQYCRALTYITAMVNNCGSVRSADKLDFVETLKKAHAGMG
jgi:hypothetical protein